MHCPKYAQTCKFILKLQNNCFFLRPIVIITISYLPWHSQYLMTLHYTLNVLFDSAVFLCKNLQLRPQTETQNSKANTTNQQTLVDQISYKCPKNVSFWIDVDFSGSQAGCGGSHFSHVTDPH